MAVMTAASAELAPVVPLRASAAESSEAQAYREAMSAFGEVAAALSEVRRLDPLLHLIAEKMCELVGVGRCSVYLRNPETGMFDGQVGRADHDIDERVKHLVAGGPADLFTQEIVETCQPVLVANAKHDPRPVSSVMREWGVRAMLGVPMVLHGEVIGVFFLDDAGRSPVFRPLSREIGATFANLAAVAIKQAQASVQTRSDLHTAAVQNNLLRRAVNMDDRLAQLALRSASLAEIASAVAELSGKPAALYDAGYQRREFADPPSATGAAGPFRRDLSACREVQRSLAAIDTTSPGVFGPFPREGVDHRFLAAPVMLRDTLWGYVILAEVGSRFGALDKHIVRRAATTVALELTAERRASASERDGRASLASDLLREDRDDASLEKRAQFFGVDLSARRVVCLLAPDSVDAPAAMPPASSVADALTAACDGEPVLATSVAEGIVAILRLPDGRSQVRAVNGVRTRVAAALRDLGIADSCLAALSSACLDATACPRGYAYARQVLTCMRLFASTEPARLLTADDLGAGRVFIASVDRSEAECFASQTLQGLHLESDAENGLMDTLQTFFENSRSVRRSAVALNVHENTIRYRLARIAETTGLDVASESSDQLTAQVALLVLQLQGRRPWRMRQTDC